jgi:hypothetical protein
MKAAGFSLLFAGWLIIIVAILLLPAATVRDVFILAGFAVEILGLFLAIQGHLTATRERA